MRALLDINVIIALFDPDHDLHERAHEWWGRNSSQGWASCPITENGVVRIMSHPSYTRKVRFSPGELIGRLEEFASSTNHEVLPDTVSLRDSGLFGQERMLRSRKLTDMNYVSARSGENTSEL